MSNMKDEFICNHFATDSEIVINLSYEYSGLIGDVWTLLTYDNVRNLLLQKTIVVKDGRYYLTDILKLNKEEFNVDIMTKCYYGVDCNGCLFFKPFD